MSAEVATDETFAPPIFVTMEESLRALRDGIDIAITDTEESLRVQVLVDGVEKVVRKLFERTQFLTDSETQVETVTSAMFAKKTMQRAKSQRMLFQSNKQLAESLANSELLTRDVIGLATKCQRLTTMLMAIRNRESEAYIRSMNVTVPPLLDPFLSLSATTTRCVDAAVASWRTRTRLSEVHEDVKISADAARLLNELEDAAKEGAVVRSLEPQSEDSSKDPMRPRGYFLCRKCGEPGLSAAYDKDTKRLVPQVPKSSPRKFTRASVVVAEEDASQLMEDESVKPSQSWSPQSQKVPLPIEALDAERDATKMLEEETVQPAGKPQSRSKRDAHDPKQPLTARKPSTKPDDLHLPSIRSASQSPRRQGPSDFEPKLHNAHAQRMNALTKRRGTSKTKTALADPGIPLPKVLPDVVTKHGLGTMAYTNGPNGRHWDRSGAIV